jgi:hypothetical protein
MCIPQALRAEFNGHSQALRATSNGVEATPPDGARCASMGIKSESMAQATAAAEPAATIELRVSAIITT